MGDTNTSMVIAGRTEVLIEDQSVQQRWEKVRSYSGSAEKFAKGMVWCQIKAGFELVALKKSLRVSQGKRTDLVNFPNGSGSWAEAVKANAGISDDTASNWMKMADGLRPELKKMEGRDLLAFMLETPPSQWTEEQDAAADQFLKARTDGRTQMDFLASIGLAKKPKAKGGAREQAGKKLTAEEELAEARRLAEEDWNQNTGALEAYGAAFTLLPDELVESQISLLERLLQARKTWLRQPQTKRNPQAIEDLLKLQTTLV